MVSATVLLARTRGDAGALAATMQRELRRIDPDVVFWQGLTLRDNVAAQLLPVAAALGDARDGRQSWRCGWPRWASTA